MKYILTLTLFSFVFNGFGQSSNFSSQRNWSKNKFEIMFQAGATQFLGDLGGRNAIGKDNSLADLDISATRSNFGIGFRYRFHPNFATTTMLNVGMLRGDDALTKEPIRNERNLSFRSPIINLNQRFEWIIYSNEEIKRKIKRNGTAVIKHKGDQLYVFSGIGIAYFNPQARFNDSWVNLRPLSTEGQGLEGGPKKYLPVTATIPFGVGFRVGISSMWRIGLEASYIKTFSDYIDDVSGTYYDATKLVDQVSTTSAALSNRAINNPTWFSAGEQRGDKSDKDAYFFLNITVTRNITYSNKTRNYKMSRISKSKF
jgi:hypothetical protein